MFVGYSLSDRGSNPPFFLSYNQSTSNLFIDWVSLYVCLFVVVFFVFFCVFLGVFCLSIVIV